MALGSIFLITPVMGWTWPSLVPIAVAVAAGYGFTRLTGNDAKSWLRGRLTKEMENLRLVSVPIDEVLEDVIGEEIGRDERLVFKKDDWRLVFRRDERGKFFIDVLGPKDVPATRLRKQGLDFAQSLVQDFAYNRLVREFDARGLNVVHEETDEETGEIVIEAQRWT